MKAEKLAEQIEVDASEVEARSVAVPAVRGTKIPKQVCGQCGKEVARSNMARHMKLHTKRGY